MLPLPQLLETKSMPIILETKQVTKRFGELAAVNNLSFDVREKEIFGIAGPNGAGKTTLFNVISGIYQGTGAPDPIPCYKSDGQRKFHLRMEATRHEDENGCSVE